MNATKTKPATTKVAAKVTFRKGGSVAGTKGCQDSQFKPTQSDNFRVACEEILALRQEDAISQANIRYAIGVIVVKVEDDPQSYGTAVVQRMAHRVGLNKSTLYEYASVARCWTESKFRHLLEAETATGQMLSWSHLVELASHVDDKIRVSLTKEVIEEGLSVRQLRDRSEKAVQESGTPAQGPPARNGQTPKQQVKPTEETGDTVTHQPALSTALTALRGIVAHKQSFNAESSRWDETFLALDNLVASDDRDDRVPSLITEATKALHQIGVISKKAETRLLALGKKLKTVKSAE